MPNGATDIPIIDLTPGLQVVMFAVNILEVLGIIPDPISLLISLFQGRPREEATVEVGRRLLGARNPAARLFGLQLLRMVKEWDIVISEGGSGRVILDAAVHQFVTNLTAQGVDLTRAREIAVHAFSRDAQAGAPLEKELMQPLPSQLSLNGPSDFMKLFDAQYAKEIALGKSIRLALRIAEQYAWKHIPLGHVFKIIVRQPILLDPPPDKVPPNQDGQCPPGYTLDPATEFCVLNTRIPPPPPPPPPGGGGSEPDPEGDEITNDLCAQMAANTAALISALQGITPGGTPDPACCDNVVAAIGDVVSVLGNIAGAIAGLAGGGAPPVDLTPVVDALNSLVTAVVNLAPGGGVDLSGVVDVLNRIAGDLEKGAGTDLTPLVDQLKKLVSESDVAQTTFQFLAQGGFLPPEELQFYQGMGWADAFFAMFKRYGWDLWVGFVRIFGWDLKSGKPYTRSLGSDTEKLFADSYTAFITGNDELMTPFIGGLVDQITEFLKPPATPAVGQSGISADRPIAFATSVAVTSGIAAYFAEKFELIPGEAVSRIAELIAGAIGFEELRDVKVRPLIQFGLERVAQFEAKKLFQQELPGNGEIMSWVARGLLEPARADELEALNGLHFSLRGPAQEAAYSGLQARMMVRAWESGLFSQGDLADELTFRGMRPASQKRMLMLAPWLATQSERNQLKATLEQAYVNGLLGDADLHQQLAQLDQETDRDALVLARVQLQKRLAFAKELEKSYSQQFTIGQTSEAQYRGLLAGLGLQDDWINSKVAADTAHSQAIAYRKELAAEAALERATAAEERKAALKNFTSGHIDAAGLTAALLLTGLNEAQAAAWVDLAVLQKAGGLRWIYGLQLPPAEAQLLRSRVTALSDQRKRQQISDPQFVSALQALGIPPHYVNSIRATADAMISPKTAAVTIPVETS